MIPVARPRNRGEPETLPEPATAPAASRSNHKRTTFDDDGLQNVVRVHWSRFKKRLTGSNVSESLLEVTESNAGSEAHAKRTTASTNDATLVADGSDPEKREAEEMEEVDEVVVDGLFVVDGIAKSLTQPSDHGGTPEKSGDSNTHGTHFTDGDSIHDRDGMWEFFKYFTAVRYRIWHMLKHFFFTSFYDLTAEAHYKRETYYQMKGLALAGSLVLLINWVLICILVPRSSTVMSDKIFYWAVAPVLTVPLPLMIIFDWPKRFAFFYQLYMSFSVWSWSLYTLMLIHLCGYYPGMHGVFSCGTKDFTGVFYYTCAFPAVALFALGQNRLSAAIMAVLNAGLIGSIIHFRHTWIRNLLNYLLYTLFLLWLHYQREAAERRLYTIRDRLKVQYRATQKAQVRESKAADSKKRFSSYIFHEVRVPLNTALLAVQNMEAMGVFDRENIEFIALEGSLNMMSKVLNDVLDFNRMDSGRFESVSKPYPFHKVMKGMLVPLQMAAGARGLELLTELDTQIDIIARTALYKARGDTEETIAKKLLEESDDDEVGLVVGDEHRLRQIVTNLTSNACKFTPSGGKIWVRTKLLMPCQIREAPISARPSLSPPSIVDNEEEEELETGPCDLEAPPLTDDRLRQHDDNKKPVADRQHVVIRIEVEDTGVGIKRKDMVDNRLFSPYVQTDLGRFQGGKGTGLGLALSKHIVRLSGGRLGVKSKRNHGSMFWVELVMGIGQRVIDKSGMNGKDGIVAESFALSRATTEAFKAPEGEGITPSTLQSSQDTSPKDYTFPQQDNKAMRQLMEHSGQIDLLPRMKHRITDSTNVSSQTNLASVPNGGPSAPPSPTFPRKEQEAGSSTFSSGTPTPKATSPPPMSIPMPPRPEFFSPSIGWARNIPDVPDPGVPENALFNPPLEVLVVDDDGLTRKLMARMLTRIGCTVETADNGKTALDLAMRATNPFTFSPNNPLERPRKVQTPYTQESDPRYDVIFLDNQMPVMSGVDMVKKLRELKRADFVVGVTGNALKEDQQEYLDAGVDAVLTKPVAEGSLKNCLKMADERRKVLLKQRMNGDAKIDDPNSP